MRDINQLEAYVESNLLADSFMRSVAVVDPKSRWYRHKKGIMNVPNWVVVEYLTTSTPSICVSLYQGTEPLNIPKRLRRPGRPGYARVKVTKGEEVNRMYPVLLESFRRFMSRASQNDN